MVSNNIFGSRETVEQVEEGTTLAPKFDAQGLIPAVTTDYTSGELLMHGYMNEDALGLTIETGEAHYFSRSRQAIWHKGATSGLTQAIRELKIDDDQDCVWLRVDVGGRVILVKVGTAKSRPAGFTVYLAPGVHRVEIDSGTAKARQIIDEQGNSLLNKTHL